MGDFCEEFVYVIGLGIVLEHLVVEYSCFEGSIGRMHSDSFLHSFDEVEFVECAEGVVYDGSCFFVEGD